VPAAENSLSLVILTSMRRRKKRAHAVGDGGLMSMGY
jgi:hypothetical protein